MQREAIKSGLIVAIGYDAETQTLEVEFHKSKKQPVNPVYSYTPFSPERFAEFKKEAEPGGSFGVHFLNKIKTDTTLKTARIQEEPLEKA